jgi:hypothetical protein
MSLLNVSRTPLNVKYLPELVTQLPVSTLLQTVLATMEIFVLIMMLVLPVNVLANLFPAQQ